MAYDEAAVQLDEEFEALRPRIWKAFARMAQEKGRKLLLRRYERYLARPEEPDTLFYGGNQMIAVLQQQLQLPAGDLLAGEAADAAAKAQSDDRGDLPAAGGRLSGSGQHGAARPCPGPGLWRLTSVWGGR